MKQEQVKYLDGCFTFLKNNESEQLNNLELKECAEIIGECVNANLNVAIHENVDLQSESDEENYLRVTSYYIIKNGKSKNVNQLLYLETFFEWANEKLKPIS